MKSKPIEHILPSQTTDRIQDVDILRGFALFGVMLVNVFYFNIPDAYFSTYYDQFTDPVNAIIFHGLNWFFSGKFYPIFSFLFGLGFAIQFMRSQQKGMNPYRFFVRRLTILLIFGVAHIVLVWAEDILFIYAAFGFVLLALTSRSSKFILGTAIFLYFVPIGFKVVGHFAHIGDAAQESSSSLDALVHFYTTASYGQILQQRISFYIQKFSQLDILISQLDRLAFFLFGLYVGRKNYIATFTKDANFWFKVLLIFFSIFVSGFLVDKIWLKDLETLKSPAFLLALEEIVIGISNLVQVFVYIIGFLLFLTIPRFHLFFCSAGEHRQDSIDGIFGAHNVFLFFILFIWLSIIWFSWPASTFCDRPQFLFCMCPA